MSDSKFGVCKQAEFSFICVLRTNGLQTVACDLSSAARESVRAGFRLCTRAASAQAERRVSLQSSH